MSKNTVKTASVLAFERKLANSDALMLAGNWEQRDHAEHWQSIAVQDKAVRGTISNRLKKPGDVDPAKLDAEIQKPNLQRVDIAMLPFDSDTLKVSFSLRVLGDLVTPSICNNQDYQQLLANKIEGYIQESQFHELAARYAENIANGRFLWRNRVGASAVEIRVYHIEQQQVKAQWTFDAYQFDLRQFGQQQSALAEMTEVIRQGLLGNQHSFLKIDAFVRLMEGQEIFPSQELVLDQTGNNKKSKFLYQVNEVAAMHSQKIGNALRTIDTWYPDAGVPIAVEPYGSVTSRGTAYRQPKQKMDFYNLLDAWVLKDKVPTIEQQHYVIANLIRGGVFGDAS